MAQLSVQTWFNGKIVAGVSVGHVAIGGLTLDQARSRLNTAQSQLSPSFVVGSKRYQPTLGDIGAHYDTAALVDQAYHVGRDRIAPHPQTRDLSLNPVLDQNRLASYLDPILKLGTAPVDARLEIHKGIIQVIPDTPGFSINKVVLEKALRNNLTSFQLSEPIITPLVLAASVRTNDLGPAQSEAQALIATAIVLTDGTATINPSASDIANWLEFVSDKESGKTVARINSKKVFDYVAVLARQLDHAAVTRKITVADGVTTVETEGVNGDGIDRDALAATLSKLTAGQPITFAITHHPVPFQTSTTNLIGIGSGRYIEINLTIQHLWVWENHAVIYESPLTSGAVGVGLGTVTGMFQIYSKKTDTHLVGRDYSVPVKYWMPFYLGYGLHDAVWRQGVFGGQDYIYNGSHGCVNLPDATAAWIYGWADVGTTVYVHN